MNVPKPSYSPSKIRRMAEEILPDLQKVVREDTKWADDRINGGVFFLLLGLVMGDRERLFPNDANGANVAAATFECMKLVYERWPDEVREVIMGRKVDWDFSVTEALLELPRDVFTDGVLRRHDKIARQLLDGESNL